MLVWKLFLYVLLGVTSKDIPRVASPRWNTTAVERADWQRRRAEAPRSPRNKSAQVCQFDMTAAKQGPPHRIVEVGLKPRGQKARMAIYSHGDIVSSELARAGSWEASLLSQLASYLRKDSVFVDIGANIGWWSFNFATEHEVYSFEPFRQNLALQNVTKCLNPSLARNIITYPFGLYFEEPATCELWQDPTINRGDTVCACGNEKTLPIEREAWKRHFRGHGVMLGRAEMRVLDQTIPESLFARDKIIKIDVEGMELKALRGATRFLTTGRTPRAILAEVTFFHGNARRELLDFFRQHGYAPLGGLLHDSASEALFVPLRPVRPRRMRGSRSVSLARHGAASSAFLACLSLMIAVK